MDQRLAAAPARRTGRRVVVITGATAGVGRATARAFAAQGADLGLLARGHDRLDATRLEAEAAGVRASPSRSTSPMPTVSSARPHASSRSWDPSTSGSTTR